MKTRTLSLSAALALSLATLSGLSSAQESTMIEQLTAPSGIRYVAGGIGQERQQAMDALSKDYNLRLTFARPKTGEFLADVTVIIENSKKEELLNVVSPAPKFYANLPNGSYKVSAEFQGKQQTKTVTIRKNQAREIVYYFAKE